MQFLCRLHFILHFKIILQLLFPCHAITSHLPRTLPRNGAFLGKWGCKKCTDYLLVCSMKSLLICLYRLYHVLFHIIYKIWVTMTTSSIVDHCANPWDLTNDMETNESAHLEIISQSVIPNGEIIAATQPRSICYATCYFLLTLMQEMCFLVLIILWSFLY